MHWKVSTAQHLPPSSMSQSQIWADSKGCIRKRPHVCTRTQLPLYHHRVTTPVSWRAPRMGTWYTVYVIEARPPPAVSPALTGEAPSLMGPEQQQHQQWTLRGTCSPFSQSPIPTTTFYPPSTVPVLALRSGAGIRQYRASLYEPDPARRKPRSTSSKQVVDRCSRETNGTFVASR